jgi:hypothetical protein
MKALWRKTYGDIEWTVLISASWEADIIILSGFVNDAAVEKK